MNGGSGNKDGRTLSYVLDERVDEVHVYCGLTRLLDIRRAGDGMVIVSAHRAYREQPCGRDLFGRWDPDDPEEFQRDLDSYLANVSVNRRHIAWVI